MERTSQTVHGGAFGAQGGTRATPAAQPLFGRSLTIGEAELGGEAPPLLAMSELYDISRKSVENFKRAPSGSSLAESDQSSSSSSSQRSQRSRAPPLTNKAKSLLRMAEKKR